MDTVNLRATAKDVEAIGKHLMNGALNALTRLLFWVIVLVGVFTILTTHFRWGMDGSDDKATGHRSGVTLRTDYGTGCQYLETSKGGITPRLDGAGKQIC